MSINPDLLSIIQQAMNRGQMPQQPLDPMGGAQAGIDPRIAAIMGQTAPQAPQRGEEQPHPIQDLLAGIIDAFGRKNATLAGITPPPSALEGLRSRRSQKTERDYEKAFTDYQVKREEFLRDQALATKGVEQTIEGERRGKERSEEQAQHKADQAAMADRQRQEQERIDARQQKNIDADMSLAKYRAARDKEIAQIRSSGGDEVSIRSHVKQQEDGLSSAQSDVSALAKQITTGLKTGKVQTKNGPVAFVPPDPDDVRQEFQDGLRILRLEGSARREAQKFFDERIEPLLRAIEMPQAIDRLKQQTMAPQNAPLSGPTGMLGGSSG